MPKVGNNEPIKAVTCHEQKLPMIQARVEIKLYKL